MTNFKTKQYAIEIYPDVDTKSRYYVGFRFDSHFFKDIYDLVESNDLDYMIEFPVDDTFFDIYSFHKWTDDFKVLFLKDNGFASIDKIRKVKADEFVSSIRLYVFHKTFHFGVCSAKGMNFHTDDLDLDFLRRIFEYHKNRNIEQSEVTM